ncbi:hypothetical protein VKT23_020576 [Stygiomarasmius scandens]|uniref:Uncharacterized protein n=1 Tax=Marasmiellus scandens TaxID=2682957 RepID=A0ABR1IKH3_9AGAR
MLIGLTRNKRNHQNLPCLEVLDIKAGSIDQFHTICAFQNAHRLVDLQLSCWGREPSLWNSVFIYSFRVPFDNLTNLSLDVSSNSASNSPFHCFQILSLCAKLEKCQIGIDDFDHNPLSPVHFTDVDPVTLPFLKTLSIFFDGDFGSYQILNAFSFPSLKMLTLGFIDFSQLKIEGRPPLVDIVLRLQTRSQFSLAKLELCNMNETVDTDSILEFFKVVPSLESFELTNCVLDVHQLSKALLVGDSKESLLPKLASIDLSEYDEGDSIIDHGPNEDDCIADMVESRLVALSTRNAPLAFEAVFAIFNRNLRNDVLDRLDGLEKRWRSGRLRVVPGSWDLIDDQIDMDI